MNWLTSYILYVCQPCVNPARMWMSASFPIFALHPFLYLCTADRRGTHCTWLFDAAHCQGHTQDLAQTQIHTLTDKYTNKTVWGLPDWTAAVCPLCSLSALSPEFKSSGLNVTNPVGWWNVHWKREAGLAVLCVYCMGSMDWIAIMTSINVAYVKMAWGHNL